MAEQKTSDFYWACRNGDADSVKKLLLKLKSSDINRVESNGSTALHAASYYGHASIVRLLLEKGADTAVRNRYGKTANEEASTEEVRGLFQSIGKREEANDDDHDIPQSKFCQLYPNADNRNKSELATRLFKARLVTNKVNKYSISAESNLEHLEKKYRKLCEEKGEEDALRKGENLFNQYRKTGDFTHMIHFYTMGSLFYQIANDDVTFLVEMYQHLLRYKDQNFSGRAYRSLQLSFDELKVYRWALEHPQSLLETLRIMSTTMDREIAVTFAKYKQGESRTAFFEIRFDEPCFTAIDAQRWSEYPHEKEVLILSGTFFQVTNIQEIDNPRMTIIYLKHVPVDEGVLSGVI